MVTGTSLNSFRHPLSQLIRFSLLAIAIPLQPLRGYCFTMRSFILASQLVSAAFAAEAFLEAPDTGLESYLDSIGNYTEGTLPDLKEMRGVPDFQWAAEQYLDLEKYSFYRTAAAGEWSE